LGPFEVTARADAPISITISARRGRALLAYLALRPEYRETRERLATLLWGDRSDKQARQSLRQCLLSLCKDLEPSAADVLLIESDTVALDPAVLDVDVRRLPTLAQSDETEELEEAARICRGEFLDGLRFESETFEDWASAERARLASLAALALDKLANRHDRRHAGAQAIEAAERLVALDPLSESAQRLLLRFLARHAGRDAALARAEALRQLVRRELDTDLEPATSQLIEEIRAGIERATGAEAVPLRPEPLEPRRAATASTEGMPAVAPTPNRPRALRRGLAACAAAAAVVILLLVTKDEPSPGPAAGSTSVSWQPPGILARVGIDQAALAANAISAVIVLPFNAVANADGGGADQRLAALITNDLINDLSRVPSLRVIARQTSQLYGGRPVDVAAIGAELGVRYVIDGDVQYQVPKLRITVSLIDAASRLEVWSQHFEREYDERFAAQDEIVNGLARALHLGVLNAEDRRRPPTKRDVKVDDLLARGWSSMAKLITLGTSSGADHYFEEALARDPENVSALIGLGGYHAGVVAMFLVSDADGHLARAEELLQRAKSLSPSSIMTYYYLGIVHKVRGEWQAALDDFTKVVKEDPSLPLAYAQVGHLASRMGRLGDGMEYVRYAIRLNPRDPNSGLISLMAGEIELEQHHDEAALMWLRRSVELVPLGPFEHAALAAALALNGESEMAAQQANETRKLAPWLTLDRMIERLTLGAKPGEEPGRIIDGLRKAFTAAG
jgi:TolB-like protein/DNA-binding SARP family transcriptional activator